MAAWSRGNGTNFDWLRKSCDISTCDLSHDGNPEKHGRSMKSANMVAFPLFVQSYDPLIVFYAFFLLNSHSCTPHNSLIDHCIFI